MEYDHPQTYNLLRKEEQLRKTVILREELGDKKTLDVGCGTGISSSLFTEVIGIDPSIALLEANPHPHKKGVAEALPFQDQEFENVIAVTSIHNFEDIEKGLLEMKRVGKYFGFSILKKSKKQALILALIKQHFVIDKEIDEGIDLIVIAH